MLVSVSIDDVHRGLQTDSPGYRLLQGMCLDRLCTMLSTDGVYWVSSTPRLVPVWINTVSMVYMPPLLGIVYSKVSACVDR